jgi:hypothetical protein
MSQNWIFINSAAYRNFVAASKERRSLLYSAGAVLGGISMAVGYVVMNLTNTGFEEEGYKSKQAELAKLPMHSQVRARVCGRGPGAACARWWGTRARWHRCSSDSRVPAPGLPRSPPDAQVVARTNREQLRAMLLDVTSGNDSERYRSLLE